MQRYKCGNWIKLLHCLATLSASLPPLFLSLPVTFSFIHSLRIAEINFLHLYRSPGGQCRRKRIHPASPSRIRVGVYGGDYRKANLVQRFDFSHLTSIFIEYTTFNLIFSFSRFYSPLLLCIIFKSRSFFTSEQIGLHVMLISVPFCSLHGPSISSVSLAVRAHLFSTAALPNEYQFYFLLFLDYFFRFALYRFSNFALHQIVVVVVVVMKSRENTRICAENERNQYKTPKQILLLPDIKDRIYTYELVHCMWTYRCGMQTNKCIRSARVEKRINSRTIKTEHKHNCDIGWRVFRSLIV